MRDRLPYLALTLAIIVAGLAVRWPGLGLPWLVAKYAGSILWGSMVYAGLRTLAPSARMTTSAAIAGAIAVAVELSRLTHTPAIDQFRLTLAGQLLLGRVFSAWNIAAYAAGIAVAALVDSAVRHRTAA